MTPLAESCGTAASYDDAAIVERVLAGDVESFARLVSKYQGPLYRYAVSMVLDHDVAADMVQDGFVRAYTRLPECRDATRFRAWLFQTVRNRCLDHLKEARRRDVPLDTAGDVPVEEETPDTRVDRQRLRADLRAAFLALPDAQREAFLLRHVHDVPYEAMAAMLDQSQSALKMRVLRARRALSAMLRGRGVTGPAHARPACGHVETFGIGHTQEES